jgi:DNA helicase II / ATP-dependent DNA helicase PcrA
MKAIDLNNSQQKAVFHAGGPLLIIAGAGSGKTRTLTSRLAHIVKNGAGREGVVAITFTNKAADEMKRRVFSALSQEEQSHNLFVGTFHSFGARILRKEARHLGRSASFTIYDSDDSLRLIKKIAKDLEIPREEKSPFTLQREISKIKSEIDKDRIGYDKDTEEAYQRYETALRENNAFDFDDLIEKVVRLFRENAIILKKYQSYYHHIMVDEFQDANIAQYELVRLLAEIHKNISVVGDDAQSIYRFRGSDFRNFLNFENDWPEVKVVTLDQNYRSSQSILDAASAVIKNNTVQKQKKLWTEKSGGQPITIVKAEDASEEAEQVADMIEVQSTTDNRSRLKTKNFRLKSKQPTTNNQRQTTAVLYRTNAQSRAIETELIIREIPYRIFGGVKFYDRKEVKDIVAALRITYNPQDSVSKERVLGALPKKRARELILELGRLNPDLSPSELITKFLEKSDYFEILKKKFKNAKERIENINELLIFAETFESLGLFLERISLLQSTDVATQNTDTATDSRDKKEHSNRDTVVQLMTIHLAKGLEFDTVFVIGCSEGLLPHQLSYGSSEELEEERRLMYVAMTRARKNLFLSFSSFPSRFLYEIPSGLTLFTDTTGRRGRLPDEDEMYIE